MYELKPIYDSRNSFYKKAFVYEYGNEKVLKSYGTTVAIVRGTGSDRRAELTSYFDFSATTLRHVKEFLKQEGFKVGSKSEMAKEYAF
jgi:hypothetical protein